MSRPGPKPTPAVVKTRMGITAPSDVNLQEPMPKLEDPELPPVPDDPVLAAAYARAREIVREVLRLQQPGLILKIDDGLLWAYGLCRAKREAMGDLWARTGTVIQGRRPGELVRNPIWIGWRDNMLMEIRLGVELGIGPSARAAIHHDPGADLGLPDIGPAPRHLRAVQ